MKPFEIDISDIDAGRSGSLRVETSSGYIIVTVDDACDQRAMVSLNAGEARRLVDAITASLKTDTLRHEV